MGVIFFPMDKATNLNVRDCRDHGSDFRQNTIFKSVGFISNISNGGVNECRPGVSSDRLHGLMEIGSDSENNPTFCR